MMFDLMVYFGHLITEIMQSDFTLALQKMIAVCCICLAMANCTSQKKGNENDEDQKQTGAREAMLQEIEMTKDPALGYVPTERLLQAKEDKDRQIMSEVNAPITGVSWKPVGPNNRGGRTRALLIDANDATGKTIFAGSVGGGLWKTTDITAASPNWVPVNDLLGNLSVISIAQDPTNAQIIYLGTGEGYGNGDGIRGLGVFKSTNGGASFTQLSSTNNSSFYYCQKVLVSNSGMLYVAANGGLYRSNNQGTSFIKVLGLGIPGATDNFCYDVEIAANGHMFASLRGSIHKSGDFGFTFEAAATLPIAATRIELACAPNDASYVYAICESGDDVSGVLRTTDGGVNWIARTNPSVNQNQAWYDLCIAVDPNNRDILYAGEIDLFKTLDGGGAWTNVSSVYSGGYLHPDQQSIHYKPGSSSDVYFTNDGGVYKCTNANTAAPFFDNKGDNYITTQFYSCAIHPTAATPYYLAGAQDNGTYALSSNVVDNGKMVYGGDGLFCHIDQDNPSFQYVSSQFGVYKRSIDGGATFINGVNFGTGTRFENPTDLDNTNNLIYSCAPADSYKRWDNPQTGINSTAVAAAFGGGQVSAIKVSPNTNNRVFFGMGSGGLFKVDNAHTATPTVTNIGTGLPDAYLKCVEVQTGNDNHLVVTYSNYGVNSVWETVNGGGSWISVEGNLPDMPVRWALFNPNNSDQVLLATELGVWSTDNLNGGSTVWGASNSGLANVKVTMLQMRQSDKLVIAATYGRGLYYSDMFTVPTSLFQASNKIGYLGSAFQFNSTSYKATSWSWSFGDGGTSATENPSHTYSVPGNYNVTLTINGGAATKTQLIKILPNRNTPYLVANGGGMELNQDDFGVDHVAGTSWVLGSSAVAGKTGTHGGSNAWVTGLTGNYVDNSETNMMTPNYNLSVNGTYALKFWATFDTETKFDGFRVEYTLDKGSNWLPLGTTTDTNWYNFANPGATTVFPKNEAFINGSMAAWSLYTRDISFLSGNSNVAFRIRFKSDDIVVRPGVAVDDLEITGPGNYWNGSVSNVWTEPKNWDGLLVPGINSTVIIPSVALNMPKLFAPAEIKSLKLMPGAVVNVSAGFVLQLNGSN
ncbi:MAG: PKD domain-containing protein [Bacteroidota bacterium]